MTTALLAFLGSGLVLFLAANTLAENADAIAEQTKLGRVWIGTVLVAGATSLPELATDVAAVRLDAPDLAAGDLFGSSLANMLILALIDLLAPKGGILRQVTLEHALSASLAILLTALAGVFVLARIDLPAPILGLESIVLLGVYLAGSRTIYRHGLHVRAAAAQPEPAAAPPRPADEARTLRRAVTLFAIASLVILLSAPFFAWAAERLADLTGIGQTFMGTWLVGISTSLPELVACLAAIRIGAFDLAVGNLFGSNALNMVIFIAMDLAHPAGSIFTVISPVHALTALFGIVLMSMGLAAIVYRAERRFSLLEPQSTAMVVAYVAALALLYVAATRAAV